MYMLQERRTQGRSGILWIAHRAIESLESVKNGVLWTTFQRVRELQEETTQSKFDSQQTFL